MNLKTNILLSLALISGLTACVDDHFDTGLNERPEQQGDTEYFIKIKLNPISDNFTRAGSDDEWKDSSGLGAGYQDGTHYEHAISRKAGNFAIFFDKDDKYISWCDLYSVNEIEEPIKESEVEKEETTDGDAGEAEGDGEGESNDGEKGEDNNVDIKPDAYPESIFTCRFYGFADRKPAKVLIVVNANQKIYKQVTDFPGWDVEDVMKQVWAASAEFDYSNDFGTHYTDDPYNNIGFYLEEDANGIIEKQKKNGEKVDTIRYRPYFTMTNTSYAEYVNGSPKLHCAEPIPEGSITTNPDSLNRLNPVDIYLERMVAKFNLSLSFNSTQYVPVWTQPLDVCKYEDGGLTYHDYSWAIEILGWGMNSIETENYLFKNLPPVEDDWLKHNGWNSSYNHRSFWAIDPHYVKNEKGAYYPWQFDNARDRYDRDNQSWYEHFQSYDNKDRSFALTYYPFTYFCPQVEKDGSVSTKGTYTGDSKTIYTPENTFVPGLQVDRSRGTRAYELAGTNLLICARLLIDPSGGSNYDIFKGNIYRNRVGVTYIDELSLFEDFMNAINHKLMSQKYIYYKYYPWDEENMSQAKKSEGDKYYGMSFRASSEGEYILYYKDLKDNKYYELTSEKINELDNSDNYRLWREADAINADGKIIPWVMYRADESSDFKPCDLYLLKKTDSDEAVTDANIDSRRLKFEYLVDNNNPKTPDDFTDDTWTPFPSGFRDDNDLQSLFYEIWGVADCYNHGLMYYAIPVYAQEPNGKPALGERRQLEDTTSGWDDESFYYYYGVIRNNWYKFTLHSIGELGYPVLYPNKPIVPNYVYKKDQVNVEMEILPMHVEDFIIDVTKY